MGEGIVGTDSVGVFENSRGEILICRLRSDTETARLWCFPRTAIQPAETPEAAVRRAARELGLNVKIHTAQPPVSRKTPEGHKVYRYHFCDAASDPESCRVGPDSEYAEARWIPKAHLREYDFAGQDADAVEWMLAE